MPQEKIEAYFRKELITELRRVVTLVRKEPTVEKKIYYFSAAYGITNRTFRYFYTDEVLLADLVLNAAHNLFAQRLMMLKSGDTTVKLDEQQFDMLCSGLTELADALSKKIPVQSALEKILRSAYSTTGNGNYLRELQLLKL
jgi:hypothetical protein